MATRVFIGFVGIAYGTAVSMSSMCKAAHSSNTQQKLPFDRNAELSISLAGMAVRHIMHTFRVWDVVVCMQTLLWWWSDRTVFGFVVGVAAALTGTCIAQVVAFEGIYRCAHVPS